MSIPSAPPTSPLHLGTLSPSGVAPKRRLTNANDAKQLADHLFGAAKPRLERARPIKGMFDGNPPYDQAKRRKRNEGALANFNSLEAESRADAAKTPYYDLTASALLIADCRTDIDGPVVDASTASRIRSEEFDLMLRAWPGFNSNRWLMLDDFIKWNKGFFWWPRSDSWHFEHLAWHRINFPNGTSTDPEKWETFTLRHEWTVTQLYRMVRDEGSAKAAGWNPPAVWHAIRQAVPKNISAEQNPIEFQKQVRDSDLYISAASPSIQAASVFTREFDGSWSRMIVVVSDDGKAGENSAPSQPQSALEQAQQKVNDEERRSARANGDARDYLFSKANVGKSVYEILMPFVNEVGDGSMNSLRGLGQRIVSLVMAKERARNGTLDNIMMRNSITLQAQTGGGHGKIPQLQLGPVTVLPPGYAVQPGTIFGDVEGSMMVLREFGNDLDVNTGTYRPQFEKPTGNPESATAANIRYSQATVLSSAAVNRYQDQNDIFYYQLYRRSCQKGLPKGANDFGVQAALRFQERCRAKGLTDEQIHDCQPGMIKAVRTLGNGSPTMRQQATGALLPLALQSDLIGPRGRKNLAREYVASWGGQRAVEAFFPPEDEQGEITNHQYDAACENADFQTGAVIPVAGWMDHFQHAITHMQGLQAAAQAVQQGAEPSQAVVFKQVAIPHIEQHIQLVRDPNRQKQLVQFLRQLEQQTSVIDDAAKQMQENQAQASNMSFEQQLQAAEMQHKSQMAQLKVETSGQLKAQQQQFSQQLAAQDQAFKQRLEDANTAAGIRRDTAKTKADIENQKVKTEAQAEAAKEKAKNAPGEKK